MKLAYFLIGGGPNWWGGTPGDTSCLNRVMEFFRSIFHPGMHTYVRCGFSATAKEVIHREMIRAVLRGALRHCRACNEACLLLNWWWAQLDPSDTSCLNRVIEFFGSIFHPGMHTYMRCGLSATGKEVIYREVIRGVLQGGVKVLVWRYIYI